MKQGLAAAATAISIDQTDPFAYFTQGRIFIFSGEHEKAISSFNRAISLNPNYALAHFGLAHGLWHAGRPAEALEHHDEAIRLSPHDPILWAFLASKAIALIMDGRYEEGIALSQEAQRNLGSQIQRSHVYAYLGEVSGLGILGKSKEAEEVMRRLRNVQSDISMNFLASSMPIVESDARERFFHGLELAGIK